MDTLTSLKVFREIVELNSFSGAAKRLAISTAMISKHVAHLEATQQTRLLNRTSRSISLTESGRLYYNSCREALDILDDAEALLGHHNGSPSGTLRVTAPQWFSNPEFARILVEYQHAYPKVKLELLLDNAKHDLVSGRYDLALRVTDKPSPTLIVRPIATLEFVLVGTPSYFAKSGRPSSPKELGIHNFILPVLTEVEGADINKDQEADAVVRGRVIRSNDTTLILQLAQSGFGLAYLPRWLVEADLEQGKLEMAIPGYVPFSSPLYAAYKNRRFLAPKIRTFIDFMACALSHLDTAGGAD
ncbi:MULTISPECIES: LysR family transcriptional regulator [Pseudomonas]|uniref:LysR family transcriptional regulator n=1 Tax=Pseudomonas TaxID=286 RepID=UPI00235DEA91|nr:MULTISPECIES: LysR family transcriptional regulator [Pseudomonas]WJV25619.1 LysR family transcriptional regulator [Pseudomonas chlororaphis]